MNIKDFTVGALACALTPKQYGVKEQNLQMVTVTKVGRKMYMPI